MERSAEDSEALVKNDPLLKITKWKLVRWPTKKNNKKDEKKKRINRRKACNPWQLRPA